MKYYLENYRFHLPIIKTHLERFPHKKTEKMFGELAVATNVPILIIAHLVQELKPEEDFSSNIRVLQEFYKHYEIINNKTEKTCI